MRIAGRSLDPTILFGSVYVDTKDESRFSRVKCSGEKPSCARCLNKGKQCEGYHPTKATKRKQSQVAAAEGSIRDPSSGATAQTQEDYGTHYHISAAHHDIWALSVDHGHPQNVVNHSMNLTVDAETYSVGSQYNSLGSLFDYIDKPTSAKANLESHGMERLCDVEDKDQ